VIPLLSLFRELAPLLAKRHRLGELPMHHGQGFIHPADDARSRIWEISPRDLAKFKVLPLIIDVREKDAFFTGHIKGATNVRRESLEVAVSEIAPDRSRAILLYSADGNQGALAAESLQRLGYLNVFSLKGGLSSWLEAGGLVETR
jgi:phage shock protein E